MMLRESQMESEASTESLYCIFTQLQIGPFRKCRFCFLATPALANLAFIVNESSFWIILNHSQPERFWPCSVCSTLTGLVLSSQLWWPETWKTNYNNCLLLAVHLQDQFSPPENFSTSPLVFLWEIQPKHFYQYTNISHRQ